MLWTFGLAVGNSLFPQISAQLPYMTDTMSHGDMERKSTRGIDVQGECTSILSQFFKLIKIIIIVDNAGRKIGRIRYFFW